MRSYKEIWNQFVIPVVIRNGKPRQKLRVRLPFAEDNRRWLDSIGKSSADWNSKDQHWELPVSWFNAFVASALKRYGRVYIFQPYRPQEKCSWQCLKARRFECDCVCMGEHHGSDINDGWFFVNEVFAVRWGDEQVSCRLLRAGKDKHAYVCVEVQLLQIPPYSVTLNPDPEHVSIA